MTIANMKFFDFQSVTVLTTDKCTAKCAHCCVSSSPKRKAKLSFDEIRGMLDALLDEHQLKVVVFAGGEPSLLKNDLVKAIRYCTDRNIHTRVVTNASWAIDEQRARGMLKKWRDAGLGDLNVSADDYHLPYIPLDRLNRVWHAAKGLGFNSVIIALAYQKGSYVTYDRLCELFGEPDIAQVYDENGIPKELDPLRDDDGTLYAICQRPASRSGRGLKLIDTEDVIHLDGRGEYSTCPWIRSSPAISPRGELVSCCGFEARRVKALHYGTLSTATLGAINARGDDVVLHALTMVGPKRLLEFVREKQNSDVTFDRHVSMCEACEDLMGKPANIKILREHAAELAAWSIARAKRKAQRQAAQRKQALEAAAADSEAQEASA